MRCGPLLYLPPPSYLYGLVRLSCAFLANSQNDPDKISVSQEYLHGLRVALETERRRVEELEAEVCRLNKELAVFRVSDGFSRRPLPAFLYASSCDEKKATPR